MCAVIHNPSVQYTRNPSSQLLHGDLLVLGSAVIRRLWNESLHIMLMRSGSRLQTRPNLNKAATQHPGLTSRAAVGDTIRVYPDSCQGSRSPVAKSSHPLHLSAASCLLLEYCQASARAIDQIPNKAALVKTSLLGKKSSKIMYLCILVSEE